MRKAENTDGAAIPAKMKANKRSPRPDVTHWTHRGGIRSFCGLSTDVHKQTTRKERVNCLRCIQEMKRHSHLPYEDYR